MKRKIAFYHNLRNGGALKTVIEFASRLKNEYQIDLYTVKTNAFKNDENNVFDNVYEYKLSFIDIIKGGKLLRIQEDLNFFLRMRGLQRRIAKSIDERGYEHVFVTHDVFIQSPYILRFLKTKSVFYCQEPWRIYYEFSFSSTNFLRLSFKKIYLLFSDYFRKIVDTQNARSATMILSNSYSSNESIFRAYGKYPFVCHLGVDVKGDIRSKSRGNYAYVIGNLSPHKGHKFVIDSLSLVDKKVRPLLYISTGGVDIDNSKNIISYGNDKGVKVKIFGRLKESEIMRLYANARVTICAAHLETLGLSAIESMACGTPVIAVREGGYRDMIKEGYNGLYIDRDEKELAIAVAKVFAEDFPIDEFSNNAVKSVYPYWSWEEATNRLKKYFMKLHE